GRRAHAAACAAVDLLALGTGLGLAADDEVKRDLHLALRIVGVDRPGLDPRLALEGDLARVGLAAGLLLLELGLGAAAQAEFALVGDEACLALEAAVLGLVPGLVGDLHADA